MAESTLVATFQRDKQKFIEAIQQVLFSLEKDQQDKSLIDEAFRLVHSLKSEASYLTLTGIAAIAHRMEDILHSVREGEQALNLDILGELLDAVDAIEAAEEDKGAPQELSNEVQAVDETTGKHLEEAVKLELSGFEHHLLREARMRGERFYRIVCEIDRESPLKYPRAYLIVNNLELLVNVIRVKPSLSERDTASFDRLVMYITTAQSEERIISALSVDEVVKVELTALSYESFIPLGRSSTIFDGGSEEGEEALVVPLSKVDELTNFIDELKIRVHQSFRQPQGREGFDEINGLIIGMEDILKGMRLIALGTAFSSLFSLVRDVSGRLGKKAKLLLDCGSIQVDRGMASFITEILVHIVRNAVDHGIEMPEERRSAGKDETGTITVSAKREEGSLVVTVSDDGCGLKTEDVLARARELKLDVAEGADILSVLMTPGFSMREKATEFSGRGFGLDLVKQKIGKMKGARIEFATEAGHGSTFTLFFPASYVALKLLMVRLSGGTFAFPISSVEAKLRIHPQMNPDAISSDGSGRKYFNGIPMYDLSGPLSGEIQGEYLLVLHYLGKRGCIPVEDFLFEEDIPSDQMTLYMEDNPHVYRVSVNGEDANFSYVSPSLIE